MGFWRCLRLFFNAEEGEVLVMLEVLGVLAMLRRKFISSPAEYHGARQRCDGLQSLL